MKKRIDELTREQINSICKKMGSKCVGCPLYIDNLILNGVRWHCIDSVLSLEIDIDD